MLLMYSGCRITPDSAQFMIKVLIIHFRYAYVEFQDETSVDFATRMTDRVLKGRQIKVSEINQ